ncbi:biopolymer transporter ExbD [bacterium]|nr:biopolymer transporter ExbD [bacterium]MBU1073001.1 biopolymer transporter ExbD [bacterium]MBU1676170.1 biopolymer transporter ExbD [bacterium]
MTGVKRSGMREENSANITPLADVTTTLIVVFLITMPAIMGNGIQVNATRAEASETVVTTREQNDDEMLMVTVAPEGIKVNGDEVVLAELEDLLRVRLESRVDKTVVIVPSDFVKLGDVVDVMDAAKGGGARSLALLNRKEGDGR